MVNKHQYHLYPNSLKIEKKPHMTLKIQVLAWDRHTQCGGVKPVIVRLLLNIYVLLKSKILLEFPHFIMQAVKTIFLRITCVIHCLDVVCMRLLVLFNFQIYWGVAGDFKTNCVKKNDKA
jgi:hypothetical protein